MALTLFRSDSSNIVQKENVSPLSDSTFKSISFILAKDLQKKISTDSTTILFDLRAEPLYDMSHIPGSLHATPDSAVSLYQSARPTPEMVILIDESAETSSISATVEALRRSGISNIHVLSGGYASWDTIAYPTLTRANLASPLDASKINAITLEEARSLRGSSDAVFLDVRSATAYEEQRLEPSLNIPLDELETRRAEIPTLKKIIVYGEDDMSSFQAGARLFDLGYLRVYTLDGSINDLKQ